MYDYKLKSSQLLILGISIQRYVDPIRKNEKFSQSVKADFATIFQEWNIIQSVSEKFLEQLENGWIKWPILNFEIGKIFITMVNKPQTMRNHILNYSNRPL